MEQEKRIYHINFYEDGYDRKVLYYTYENAVTISEALEITDSFLISCLYKLSLKTVTTIGSRLFQIKIKTRTHEEEEQTDFLCCGCFYYHGFNQINSEDYFKLVDKRNYECYPDY